MNLWILCAHLWIISSGTFPTIFKPLDFQSKLFCWSVHSLFVSGLRVKININYIIFSWDYHYTNASPFLPNSIYSWRLSWVICSNISSKERFFQLVQQEYLSLFLISQLLIHLQYYTSKLAYMAFVSPYYFPIFVF